MGASCQLFTYHDSHHQADGQSHQGHTFMNFAFHSSQI